MIIKKYCTIFLIYLVVCTGCTSKQELQICDVFKEELESNGVEDSKILSLGDFSVLSYEIEDIELSEDELQQVVDEVMESYNRLLEDTKKTIVEEGDFVTIEYESICEGKIIDSNKEEVLKVGAGFFDPNIESSLIGAKKGKTYSVQITIPEGEGNLSGKEETTTITVKKIQYMEREELTETFVKENYDLDSVEEFYDFLKEQKESQMRQKSEIEANNKLMEQAIRLCEYTLDEDEILKVALNIYEEYEYAAKTYGISVEEYMNSFMGVTENIYEECFREAKEQVQRELMTGAIAFEKNITGEGEEFDVWMKEKGIAVDGISGEDLQSYKKSYLEMAVEKHFINLIMKGN